MSDFPEEPQWLREHRDAVVPYNPYIRSGLYDENPADQGNITLSDVAFNKHSVNDGEHVSPYDQGNIHVGTAGLRVELVQGVNFEAFKDVLSSATRATVGIDPHNSSDNRDWEEMMHGGLQSALETQSMVFRVYGASRALTHQLVRSRNAAFHQQSQRATFYGDRPDVRMPLSVYNNKKARRAFQAAVEAAWHAYQLACDLDISYQDARFVLPEGTVNFIQCTYTVREFINVFAYRGCSMFMWEMVDVMRKMRVEILKDSPWLEPYVKISCEKTGRVCGYCSGDGHLFIEDPNGNVEDGGVRGYLMTCEECLGHKRVEQKCTFQGWESPEGQCSFPWAKDGNRTFKPMFHQIGRRPGMEDKK